MTNALAGQRFGRLTVLQESEVRRHGYIFWRCLCDCGSGCLVASNKLRTGHTRSCGCLQREHARNRVAILSSRNTRHGHCVGKPSRAYRAWGDMLSRCNDPNNRRYPDYGGRGICVCERWRKFENFLADMGDPPLGQSLDRRNNDGNYEPGNCRWATRSQQQRNKRAYRSSK